MCTHVLTKIHYTLYIQVLQVKLNAGWRELDVCLGSVALASAKRIAHWHPKETSRIAGPDLLSWNHLKQTVETIWPFPSRCPVHDVAAVEIVHTCKRESKCRAMWCKIKLLRTWYPVASDIFSSSWKTKTFIMTYVNDKYVFMELILTCIGSV